MTDRFFRSRMIKKRNNATFTTDDIIFVNKDSNNITFFSDEMGLLSVGLNNINLDDYNLLLINST